MRPKKNHDKIQKGIAKERMTNIFVAMYAKYENELLRKYLSKFGMQITLMSEDTVEDVLATNKFDLIITDLPEDASKIPAFIRKIYAFAYPAFVMVICSDYEAQNAVLAMESGAVCCLMYPISYDVILSQIQALVRAKNNFARTTTIPTRNPIIEFGDYSINLSLGKLYYKGMQIPLTPDALSLLAIMAENLDNIVSINTLCMKVFGVTGTKAQARLRMQIKYLRQVLGMDGDIEILNQFNTGYGLSIVHQY